MVCDGEGDGVTVVMWELLTVGTKRMALNVTSPSAVKWILASGVCESWISRDEYTSNVSTGLVYL